MQELLRTFFDLLHESGFGQMQLGNLVMMAIGLLFIFLAIRKNYEPLLLVPIGFGMLIGNIPYDAKQSSLGVYDGPVSESKLVWVVTDQPVIVDDIEVDAWSTIPGSSVAKDLVLQGRAVMVHTEEFFVYRGEFDRGAGVYDLPHGGHSIYYDGGERTDGERYPVVVHPERQDLARASVLWFLFRGIEWGIYPPLIFLGVGALIDFGPLLANPRTILLGAAAQFGIFGALFAAVLLGFNLNEAASIGIIGGADGPTAIFTCTMLAPHLLGAVALAAYSYMAMVPVIQPPIMRLLTTKKERLIRMDPPKDVPRFVRVVFPICGFILTALLANAALPLLGMLFFGNLLRESLVTERLARTAQTAFIDIVTILLGVTVGAKTQAASFLTPQTIKIFLLGVVAFSLATAAGILFAKLMNLVSKNKINPLIGAAGVSAVPMSARVVQKVAQEEDPHNMLLMHAMGPNVAGVIGSAVAAGVLLSGLGN